MRLISFHSDSMRLLKFGTDGVLVWAAVTQYYKLGGLNSKQLFLTVVDAGNVRSGCRHGCLVQVLFWAEDEPDFPLNPHIAERVREVSGVSFVRVPGPFMRALFS